MPTKSDWAVARSWFILAIIAYFGKPWTWQMLLIATVAVLFAGYVIEKIESVRNS